VDVVALQDDFHQDIKGVTKDVLSSAGDQMESVTH
jgi:hypothetical protein